MKKELPILFALIFSMSAYSSELNISTNNIYIELGINHNGEAGIGAIGVVMASPYAMAKVGLAGLVLKDNEDYYGGIDIGTYFTVPCRVSPYAGIGIFGGYSKRSELADNDGIDNDDNGFVDESGEETEKISDTVASIYPEVGLNFWINDRFRIYCFSKYYFLSSGRDDDCWIHGLGLSASYP